MGVAYKKNFDGMRESPEIKLIELLEKRGASVEFYDPHAIRVPKMREHPQFAGRTPIKWDPSSFGSYDAVLIATDHDDVDYHDVDYRALCERANWLSTLEMLAPGRESAATRS